MQNSNKQCHQRALLWYELSAPREQLHDGLIQMSMFVSPFSWLLTYCESDGISDYCLPPARC